MDRPKHIVIDARIRETSTGRYADRLLMNLQALDPDHKYTVLLKPGDQWKPTAPNFHSLPCPFPQFSFNPVHQICFAWQLYRLRPNLVHFTMTQQPLLYFGKSITTTHDLTMFRFVRKGGTPSLVYALKMGLYRLLFRWAHLKSARILVPSNYVAHDLGDYQTSIKRRIVVTYEAGESPAHEQAEQPACVSDNDTFLLYVGTAFPHKNLPRLVDAFDLLHKKNPKLLLVLVGRTEVHYRELQEYINKYACKNSIRITGFIPDTQLKWLYEHCSVYVFPSLSEGFGLPGLEAMAHGAPVVSSNATCLPEIYDDAALYFDPTNPKDIAKKVSTVLDSSSLRRSLIERGAKQVACYSWSKMAAMTLYEYRRILKEK